MKVVLQRVKHSSVSVSGTLVNKIGEGILLLVGFTEGDSIENIAYMCKKVSHLRIFDDENGIMNKSILDIKGSILCISQFTLYGDAKKGNRPSYIKALDGAMAKPLYEMLVQELNKVVPTYTGVFGGDMQIELLNDGPVTILLEK